jgi:hypothetical protein
MSNMMLNASSQACRDFRFNLTQGGEHWLLVRRRIQPRKIPL